MKKILSLIIALVLSLSLVGALAEGLDEPVYIAWVGPLTGSSSNDGNTEKNTLTLAVEKINSEGGIMGHELVIDFYDDAADANEATSIANKIIDEEKYFAVIGSYTSTTSMNMAYIFQEEGMVQYSPTASHADYSSIGNYIFRNTPTQSQETAEYANFVYNDLGIKTVAIIYQSDDWGVNINNIFTENYEALGGQVLNADNFVPDSTKDFASLVTTAKATGAEAIFVVAYYKDSASIVMKIRDLEFDGDVVITSTCLKQAFTETAGDAANGCYLINAYCADINTDEFKAVKELYESTYGVAMDAFVMQTWDVIFQLVAAAEEAGSFDTDAIRDVLDGMTYEALGGEYTMNEVGDAIRGLFRLQVRDGAFVNITDEF
ncbi:MAG: ABC transporter substrate-binding protein [Clostridia bacterium]|nr:ABC transporter substrate-binding protein [Clostridia bacterium]